MKTGHCIICHRDGVELSDEHVIPDAIGGYYHIYSVCKECNSHLGDNVDIHLVNHWFIKASRHTKQLAGKKKNVPNPLVGDGVMDDGTQVRLEEDKSGKIVAHILAQSPIFSSDGKTGNISFSLDVKDEKQIDKIVQKVMIRNGIDPTKVKVVKHQEVRQIEHPTITTHANIDLALFKIGLLKIAYEFAVDKIPGYYNDSTARLFSEILHRAATDRLAEVNFAGDGFAGANHRILETFIDPTNTDRHILLLTNLNNKLYCLVKLFDNTISQVIQMSDKAYGEENTFLLAINDFARHDCRFFNATDLVRECIKGETVRFKLSEEAVGIVESEQKTPSMGWTCNRQKDNLLFDLKGHPQCTQSQLVNSMELSGQVDEQQTGSILVSSYKVPEGLYFQLAPSNRLIRVESIEYLNEVIKL